MFRYLLLVFFVSVLSVGALKLSPGLSEAERYVNDSYVVTCFGQNATGARWIGPENVPISPGVGRIHTEERNDFISLVFEYILRNDSGHYFCSKDEQKVSFKLTVVKPIKFRPGLEEQSIEVGSSDQVTCEAEGIPQPSFMWHINGSIVKGRRYTPLPSGLHIMNVTREDKGIYLCRAYQVTTQTSIVMDQIINVSVHYKPAWKTWNDWYGYIGGTANLTCEVDAEPLAEFAWTQNNQTIEAPRIITEPNRSILQVNVSDETVFGTYECRAWNKLGSIKRSGELKEGVKPDPPIGVAIDKSVADKVKLTVTFGSENQNVLGIRVELQELSGLPVSWENSDYRDLYQKDGPYILTDLKANTNYIIRVATLGQAGLSDFTEEKTFTKSSGVIVWSSRALTYALLFLSISNYFRNLKV